MVHSTGRVKKSVCDEAISFYVVKACELNNMQITGLAGGGKVFHVKVTVPIELNPILPTIIVHRKDQGRWLPTREQVLEQQELTSSLARYLCNVFLLQEQRGAGVPHGGREIGADKHFLTLAMRLKKHCG